jgi:hypothetical protein
MYACILIIRAGFFSAVCGLEDRPLTFRDLPPPPLDQEEGSGTCGTVLTFCRFQGRPDNADTLTNGKG